MPATTALTLPRRPPRRTGPRRLPVPPIDPPYDDEHASGSPFPTFRRPAASTRPMTLLEQASARFATGPLDGPVDGTAHGAADDTADRGARPAPADGMPSAAWLPAAGLSEPVPTGRGEAGAGPARGGREPAVPAQRTAAPAYPGTGQPGTAREIRGRLRRPDPRVAAAIVVRAIVEVLSGARPATHLAGWTSAQLQADLERTVTSITVRQPGRVRSVRVSEPRVGVAEVCAVINRGRRVAALALRMEWADARWRVTTLQLG